MKKLLFTWAPFAVAITLITFMIYGAVQQDMRTSADDPQIQLAEDVADALQQEKSHDTFATIKEIDIAKSLQPFVIVYDENKKLLSSQAVLNGEAPTPPEGVLDYAKEHGQNRVTWQPATGVRSAIVVVHFKNDSHEGYVLAGRSLREVEKREADLVRNLAIGWAVTMGASLIAVAAMNRMKKSSRATAPVPNGI